MSIHWLSDVFEYVFWEIFAQCAVRRNERRKRRQKNSENSTASQTFFNRFILCVCSHILCMSFKLLFLCSNCCYRHHRSIISFFVQCACLCVCLCAIGNWSADCFHFFMLRLHSLTRSLVRSFIHSLILLCSILFLLLLHLFFFSWGRRGLDWSHNKR